MLFGPCEALVQVGKDGPAVFRGHHEAGTAVGGILAPLDNTDQDQVIQQVGQDPAVNAQAS